MVLVLKRLENRRIPFSIFLEIKQKLERSLIKRVYGNKKKEYINGRKKK